MKAQKLSDLQTGRLIEQFTAMAVEQDEALLANEIARVNRITRRMEAIAQELKFRPGDERSKLLALYHHPNMQVQMKAAAATLAIAPGPARAALEVIRVSGWQPQALHAGMTLYFLDRGIAKPT